MRSRNESRGEIEERVLRLQALRDEVRVRLHLAGMDAKEEWDRLEARLAEIERRGEHVAEATVEALAVVLNEIESFRRRLG